MHVPLSPSSIIWYGQGAVMPCGWGDKRRSGVALAMHHRLKWSGVALAMHHRLKWFIQIWAHGPSTLPMLSCGVRPIYLHRSIDTVPTFL